jgi:hypothetical protein
LACGVSAIKASAVQDDDGGRPILAGDLYSAPVGPVEQSGVQGDDAQGGECSCAGEVGDFNPFDAFVFGKAPWDGFEVAQGEAGEVWGSAVVDVFAVEVDGAGVVALSFDVGQDSVPGSIELAGWVPAVE